MDTAKIYNYADDNTLSCSGPVVDDAIADLEAATESALRWFDINGLQANPDKFQVMILNGTPSGTYTVKAGDNEIAPSDTVKLLGVHIDDHLTFNQHITYICRNAAKQLNALSRLRRILTTQNKMNILNAFILANFNYCPLVWHECGVVNSRKIEKLQERGLRFVYNDFTSTYDALLHKSGKSLLYVNRVRSLASEVYKIINHIGPSMLHELFEKKDIHVNIRDSFRAVQPKVRTTRYGLNSLKYNGAKIWNSLSVNIKGAISLSNFKCLINKWNGPKCSCGYCIICL